MYRIPVRETSTQNSLSKSGKSSYGEEYVMKQQKEPVCPVEMTLSIVGGRWKLPIVYRLLSGTKRFGELRRLIPDATQQMLTMQLRELEQMGILHRQVYAQVPPKVEYSLTELGQSLEPIILQIYAWGEWYCNQNDIEHWHMSDDVEDHVSV
jgi:DNA-binding HxlR family transcriptional regulator